MQINTKDIIMASVVGTNGKTRHQKTGIGRWDGAGNAINDDGQFSNEPKLEMDLTGAVEPPKLDPEAYAAAAKQGEAELEAFMLAQAGMIEAWKKNKSGGTLQQRIAKAVQQFMVKHKGFLDKDGDGFVLLEDNLEVKSMSLTDGRTAWLVSGNATFGSASCYNGEFYS